MMWYIVWGVMVVLLTAQVIYELFTNRGDR
jgi:hypothetical protein